MNSYSPLLQMVYLRLLPLASDTSGALSFSNSTALVPRILSYNVNGLSFYASDSDGVLRKSLAVQAISDFVSKCDVICLQETNLTLAEKLCFSSLPGCSVSYNNFKRGVAGTLIIDTPSILKLYQPRDVSLPLQCGGYVQCRRYEPLSPTHKAFQIVNCYLYTGPDKLLFSPSCSTVFARSGICFLPLCAATLTLSLLRTCRDATSANEDS